MKSHIAKLFLAFYVPYLLVETIVISLILDKTFIDTLLSLMVTLPATFSGNIWPSLAGFGAAWLVNKTQQDDDIKQHAWFVLMASVAGIEFFGLIFHFANATAAWRAALVCSFLFAAEAFRTKKKMQKSANAGTVIASSVKVEETLMTRVDATWKKTGSSEMFKIYLKNRDRVCHLEQHMRGESMAEYHQLFAYSYYLVFGYDVDKQLSKYSSDAVVRALVAALKNLRIIDGYGHVVSNFMIESYKDIYKATVKNLKL